MKMIVLLAGFAAALPPPFEKGIPGADMLTPLQLLKEPERLYSANGELFVEMDFTTCEYTGPYTNFTTRCYGIDGVGMLAPPTLYVYPGDTLSIKLTNRLSDANNVEYHNFWQKLNYTNLHFHGGHISGNAPSDDVLTLIEPAHCNSTACEYDSITYIYELPD